MKTQKKRDFTAKGSKKTIKSTTPKNKKSKELNLVNEDGTNLDTLLVGAKYKAVCLDCEELPKGWTTDIIAKERRDQHKVDTGHTVGIDILQHNQLFAIQTENFEFSPSYKAICNEGDYRSPSWTSFSQAKLQRDQHRSQTGHTVNIDERD